MPSAFVADVFAAWCLTVRCASNSSPVLDIEIAFVGVQRDFARDVAHEHVADRSLWCACSTWNSASVTAALDKADNDALGGRAGLAALVKDGSRAW